MLSKEDLAAIQKRVQAASPGPWNIGLSKGEVRPRLSQYIVCSQAIDEDVAFIAASRTDIPNLLSYIAEQESEIAARDDEVRRLNQCLCRHGWDDKAMRFRKNLEHQLNCKTKETAKYQAECDKLKAELEAATARADEAEADLEEWRISLRFNRPENFDMQLASTFDELKSYRDIESAGRVLPPGFSCVESTAGKNLLVFYPKGRGITHAVVHDYSPSQKAVMGSE